MRKLAFLLSIALLSACASFDAPKPLTGADIVGLAQSGMPPQQIIDELKRTNTVLPLQASDILSLHESGVSKEVLDYLQRAQIDEIRWRDRYSQGYWYGPGYYRGFGPCPFPPLRPYRGGPWGC
jgi:hypothetical protein